MTFEHTNLHAASLDREMHERTCGYWYTVTAGALAHTAFATRAGLDRWLRERNLELHDELPEQGEVGHSRIIGVGEWQPGVYRSRSYLYDAAEFDAVRPVVVTAVMSNGDYTLGLIDEDADGVRTVHYLNPNVKTRLVFEHQRTRQQMS